MHKAGPIVAIALLVGCGAATGTPEGPGDACPSHATTAQEGGTVAPDAGQATDSGEDAREAASTDGAAEANDAANADGLAVDDAGPATDGAGGVPHDASAGSDAPPGHCDDNLQDFDETDVDCGGSCPACWLAQHCLKSLDCNPTSPGCNAKLGGCACDAVSMTCVASRCADHRKDGDESDVDCGGSVCVACGTGGICTSDYDCANQSCDALTATCDASPCADHHQDGNETDVDCGGGRCTPCPLGKGCSSDYDCTSSACDAASRTCITDACFDHHQDGVETDVDCGGSVCAARCAVGQWCKTASDCMPGHTCSSLCE